MALNKNDLVSDNQIEDMKMNIKNIAKDLSELRGVIHSNSVIESKDSNSIITHPLHDISNVIEAKDMISIVKNDNFEKDIHNYKKPKNSLSPKRNTSHLESKGLKSVLDHSQLKSIKKISQKEKIKVETPKQKIVQKDLNIKLKDQNKSEIYPEWWPKSTRSSHELKKAEKPKKKETQAQTNKLVSSKSSGVLSPQNVRTT